MDLLADALDRMTDDSARRAMADHAAILGAEQSLDRHVARLIGVLEQVAATRNPTRSRGTTSAHPRAMQSMICGW